jgi:hypothetical protein
VQVIRANAGAVHTHSRRGVQEHCRIQSKGEGGAGAARAGASQGQPRAVQDSANARAGEVSSSSAGAVQLSRGNKGAVHTRRGDGSSCAPGDHFLGPSTKRNSNVVLMFMNLYRLVSVFKDYFGELEERLLKPLNLHISHCLQEK